MLEDETKKRLTEAGDEEGGDEKPEKKRFDNLDLREVYCFGFCPRASTTSWVNLADQSVTRGWKHSDVRRIDYDLKTNVDACYFFICQGTFVDLDTQIRWRARFENIHSLWQLELVDGKHAEVLPEDAADFFGCEYFKKFTKRCGDKIVRAVEIYRKIAERHVREGDLMAVDPVKLEAILECAETKRFMDNLRNCKYELK